MEVLTPEYEAQALEDRACLEEVPADDEDRLYLPPKGDVQSLQYEQGQILFDILSLHGRGAQSYDADLTFGKGGFYRGRDGMAPRYRFDKDDNLLGEVDGLVVADSTAVPLDDGSVASVVFDPPFLTYVRAGRNGNGNMVMARQFSGYWTYPELTDHYTRTLDEAHRILKRKGIMVFKCQDIIHNHKMHATHVNVIMWAEDRGFRLKDLYVLGATHRLPRPNQKGPQQHARIHHSYFLVLEKR